MSGKERKRDKVKKKIKKLYERLKKSTDLPKEVRLQVQTALQDVSGPSLYIGGDLPVAKPNRENTVFQRITAIVLEVGDQNPSFQGFANHPWDPKKPKKGTLADQIRCFEFDEIYNLIHTIHNKWNVDEHGRTKNFDEAPNPKALFAIKELMNILTKIEQTKVAVNQNGMTITRERIVGLSHDPTINEFFCNCFRGIENYTLDKDYYNFVVQGIERCYIDSEEKKRWQAY
jgi:hypothetical protein